MGAVVHDGEVEDSIEGDVLKARGSKKGERDALQGLGEAGTSVGVMGVRQVPQDLMGQRLV